MDVTIPAGDTLSRAVAWAARALPARPVAPVLAGLRLTAAADGALTLEGFDYEVSARSVIQASVSEPGTILLPGRLLAEITPRLPGWPVTVTSDGTRATLTCGNATFTLILLPCGEYPSPPGMPGTAGTIDDASMFARAIEQVTVAAARDDTLPVLTGVLMEPDGDSLCLAATDRYRLAIRDLPWNPAGGGLESSGFLIPARVLTDLARAVRDRPGEITIAVCGGDDEDVPGLAGFQCAGYSIITRLLAGQYIKYRSSIPAEFTASAQLASATLADAVKRAALVAERNTPVRLTFSPDELLLEAGTGDEAQASETIPVMFDGDGDLRTAFNPHYLLDAIAAHGGDVTHMAFTSPSRPAVITGQDTTPDYRHILMPIRSAG